MLALVFDIASVTRCIVKITIFVILLVVPCLPFLTQTMCVTAHRDTKDFTLQIIFV